MKLTVDLGDRSYPIVIEPQALSNVELDQYVSGRKVCIVTNETVAPLYIEALKAKLTDVEVSEVILPDGEKHKTMASIETVFDHALTEKLNRKSVMIALGGGVIGDMTGFAAACYQRGIDFIQVPTTLLSQVDSSVGGKTGINHPLGKNMIGAFYQPKLVVIDTNTLTTLPSRELAAGMAEVIKYGLIFDFNFFEWLEQNMDGLVAMQQDLLVKAIHRSCEIKAEVVSKDEHEAGIRAILNLGHTFGHAIESVQGYGEWLHGEAVSVGMVMAVDLSERLGWVEAGLLSRTKKLLERAGLPVTGPANMTVDEFLEAMSIDKKNVNGKIRLVLLKAPGEAVVTEDFDSALMSEVIRQNLA